MMPGDSSRDRPDIHGMFDRIAPRYDLVNSLMTLGRDKAWRKYVIGKTRLPQNGRLLDIGTGTGGIAMEALSANASLTVVGADFAMEMMQTGRLHKTGTKVHWCRADALKLPFPDDSFDAVTSGYLIRNVVNPSQAFREQARLVRPGGRVVCLDTSPPRGNLLYPFILLHFKVVIPLMGGLISGSRQAYTYLPESTRQFKTPEELSAVMRSAGIEQVSHRTFMFGTIAVHVGTVGTNRS